MKKKRLTVNTLALGNLKHRKKQYAILIIGIILAMVFSSSTLFFLSSSNETFRANEIDKMGKQDAIVSVYHEDEGIWSKALEEGVITDYGLAHIIGYGYINSDERDMGTAIAWLDDKAKDISNQTFIEGTYPMNENEIAIEQNALAMLGINAKIGDEITLNVDIQDSEKYHGTSKKTYKLVGIVTDKRSEYSDSNFIPSAFVAQGTQTEIGGKELLTAYVTTPENASKGSIELLNWVVENSDEYINFKNVNAYWENDFFSGITDDGAYIVIISIVLVFVSCIAIVNAFNTNLKERKKQIGMLRAVGATKRQIIKIFGREAFFISLICAPISIALSYGIVRLAISFMSEKAVMTQSFSVLGISAVVCIIITMLSAIIPLLHAARITPMQAIRNIDINRKMNIKKIKSKKEFDVPSHLAKRNAKFYKGGKIAVSVILTVTIIISCFGFSFFGYMKDYAFYSGRWDYQLSGMGDNDFIDYVNHDMRGLSEAEKRDVETYPLFSKVVANKYVNSNLEVDKITDYFRCFWSIADQLQQLEDNDENIQEYVNSLFNGKNVVSVPMYSFDQRTLKTIEDNLTAGKLDYDKLASGEEIILIAPQSAAFTRDMEHGFTESHYDEEIPENEQIIYEGENPYSVGDKISLSVLVNNGMGTDETDSKGYNRTDREVTIGAIISPNKLSDEVDGCIHYSYGFAFLTLHSGMNYFCESAKYQSLYMNVDANTEIDGEIDEMITDYINTFRSKYGGGFQSTYARAQESRNTGDLLSAAMLSIVMIGFVICAAIINNSLTASVREKKKEIGTLRAVGADISMLVKSYIRQLLSMLGFGYGVGFATFSIIYALIFIVSKIKENELYLVFNPWETLAFCLILFAICSINLWSKVRKEMKNSIVENIKEL